MHVDEAVRCGSGSRASSQRWPCARLRESHGVGL